MVEFGTRRAHSPEAGVLAGRAAYIGGCTGTSNTETGFRFGIPVFGTNAHAWVMSFTTEIEAFRQLQELLGDATAYLIDSYDTLKAPAEPSRGTPDMGRAPGQRQSSRARSGRSPHIGQRRNADAKIMATGDLNEYKILELVAANTPSMYSEWVQNLRRRRTRQRSAWSTNGRNYRKW